MSLQKKIKDDIKTAMIARDSVSLLTLRGIANALTRELDKQKRPVSDELSDEDTIRVLQSLVKQRKDSIEQFTKGNRPDLVASETAELAIVEKYVPAMMTKEDIKKIAEAKKVEMGIADKTQVGKLMSTLMKDLRGKANGSDVKEVVESLF